MIIWGDEETASRPVPATPRPPLHLGTPRGQQLLPSPGPLTLNLSDMLSVMLPVNGAILGTRPLPFWRSGPHSVLVFTTTLSRKEAEVCSGVQPGGCGHLPKGDVCADARIQGEQNSHPHWPAPRCQDAEESPRTLLTAGSVVTGAERSSSLTTASRWPLTAPSMAPGIRPGSSGAPPWPRRPRGLWFVPVLRRSPR